ncbi:MAG: two-component sensor histidine kinase [Chloroflexi bacterium]|nr:MAG: two-component sensor histidine kinase [Chloroflexota bacterium]MBA4375366.1 hypothetical protein [Anaerolinea sp.]
MDKQKQPRGNNKTKLLTLCSLVSRAANWKDALEEIFRKTREDLIFDNLVVYQTDFESQRLDVLYARATGRGKSAEADASWGEIISNRVLQESKIIIEKPETNNSDDRIASPYLLGIPIYPAPNLPGVLVYIRFGGPAFSRQNIQFALFIADLITSIIRKKCLEEFVTTLENEKAVAKLQADFINTISHELRSPLGFIKGYTTTLLRKDTNWDQSTQNDFLEIIERETNNLTDLIDDLLDSSRLQSGQMKFDFQVVRVDSLIRDEVNRAHITNPKQEIILDFDHEIPTIEGDARRLAQVFDNLLSNSAKYAPEAQVVIKLTKNQNHLDLQFKDNGPGIPEQFLPKIFTRFFRVPDKSMKVHGSGLGLFICKQIIDSHEGTICVSSSENGTTFIINLPFAISRSG